MLLSQCALPFQDGPHEYDYIDESDSAKKGHSTLGGYTPASPPAKDNEYFEIPEEINETGPRPQAVPSHPTKQKSNRAQPKPRPHKYINTHGHAHSNSRTLRFAQPLT